MGKPPALADLMTAVDAGLVDIDSGSFAARRRGNGYGHSRVAAAQQTTSPSSTDQEASFEFSAAVSNSSASPASMVFSDGQLRAHEFPAVRRSPTAADGSQQLPALGLSSSMAGSQKRVRFAADGGAGKAAAKTGGGAQRKGGGGGLLGCMGSACGLSRDQVVEPAVNGNRKAVSV